MSVARVVALAFSATTTQVAVWTALECSIAIIVACRPALRGLLRSSESHESSNLSWGSRHGRKLSTKPKSQAINETKRVSEHQDTLWEDEPTLGLVTSARGEFVLKSIDTETVSATSQTSKPGDPRLG